MQSVDTITALKTILADWRKAGLSIAFVPTMGNLHAGHLHLVEVAKTKADKVVVSIFVNPTQFGPNEDFAAYPRTLAADQQQLINSSVDMVFMPTSDMMYPSGAVTQITVDGLSQLYCGAFRPGHFTGVATVVAKLFNIVQPDLAVFGEKDFQQLTIIRQMVRDLNLPVALLGVPTVREADGLAMSSRNGYLLPEQRQIAPILYHTLQQAKELIVSGETDFLKVETEAKLKLEQLGLLPDYFTVCNVENLLKAAVTDKHLVILVAVKLGKTRLIDNIKISIN